MPNTYRVDSTGKPPRVNTVTGAQRDDSSDKSRPDLVGPEFLERLGEHLRKGAEKYEPWNWYKGQKTSETLASLERHIQALKSGEDTEDHVSAIAFAAMTYARAEQLAYEDPEKYESLLDAVVYQNRRERAERKQRKTAYLDRLHAEALVEFNGWKAEEAEKARVLKKQAEEARMKRIGDELNRVTFPLSSLNTATYNELLKQMGARSDDFYRNYLSEPPHYTDWAREYISYGPSMAGSQRYPGMGSYPYYDRPTRPLIPNAEIITSNYQPRGEMMAMNTGSGWRYVVNPADEEAMRKIAAQKPYDGLERTFGIQWENYLAKPECGCRECCDSRRRYLHRLREQDKKRQDVGLRPLNRIMEHIKDMQAGSAQDVF